MMKFGNLALLAFVLLGYPMRTEARIWLPSVLSDGMVLQQQTEVTLWGWTDSPDETLTVYGSWNGEKVTARAEVGLWRVKLRTPAHGGPYEIHIEGHETVVLKDVLIGEVWVCSGQSNMEWTPASGIDNAAAEIAAAENPDIRFFKVPRRRSAHPQDDTPGNWQHCTPETMEHFSAVAYFFAREIVRETGIPVGLISSSWGGTPVEAWMPEDAYADRPELLQAAKDLKEYAWWPTQLASNYNAMIHPLLGMTLAGVIWYQGESNLANIPSYYESFPLLIRSWRQKWGQDFPFYFVQLAPYKYEDPKSRNAAVVRDAQLQTLKTVSQTGMVVTTDIGNLEDIHPKNKQEVGRRLALWALAGDYGKKDLVLSGPVYSGMEIDGNKVRIRFEHTGGGLVAKGNGLTDFEIAGADQVFHPARARIRGATVEVWAPGVREPAAVRFGFTNGAEPNLFNREGLPASPFRTDNWDIPRP